MLTENLDYHVVGTSTKRIQQNFDGPAGSSNKRVFVPPATLARVLLLQAEALLDF
jgi:hypothetical protein